MKIGNASEAKLMKYLDRDSKLIPYAWAVCSNGKVRYVSDKLFEGPVTYVDGVGFYVGDCAVEDSDKVTFFPKISDTQCKAKEFRVTFKNEGLPVTRAGYKQADLQLRREMRKLLEDVELDGYLSEYELMRDIGRKYYNMTTEQDYAPLHYRTRIGFFLGADTLENGDIVVRKPNGEMAKRNPKIFKVTFLNKGLIPA